MKTSTAFKENTVFSSAVMTRLTWRYRGRELITASNFKFLEAGDMSWILGLDSKSLKQNHSWTSLSILNNWNSLHVYFRWEILLPFCQLCKEIKRLSNTHYETRTHTHVSYKNKEIHDRVDTRVQLVWRLRVMSSCQYINYIYRRPRRGKLEDGCFSKWMRCATRKYE